MPLDPVTLALVQNRLDHVCHQMGWVMQRTARSPIFSHAHDFSCFITDAAGVIISQADGIPIHTGCGGFAVRALIGAFGDDVAEDDVFLLSDPYAAGGNHLPDWVIARPVFHRGRRVAFTCNRAHQSDIGGGAAGTYNPEASEIWHEGIRLPPLRLVERGTVRDDLWNLLLLNTRMPHFLDGDLLAMLGSTRIGSEQVVALFDQLGSQEGVGYFAGILEHADQRFRAAIAELPSGTYEGEDWFDNDCFEPMDIRVHAEVTIGGDGLTVDFTRTSPQIRGFKNSSLANTHSSVYAGLVSFLEPTIPRNEGTFRSVSLVAPEGTLVNPRPGAALTMCTVFPAAQIMHAVWRALGQAAPERACAGWGNNSFPITSGTRAGDGRFVMYHWAGSSGGGAVEGRDGFPQQGGLNALGGLVIPNVEAYEALYPVRIHRQELREDAGGVGEYRGGTGVHYEADVLAAVEAAFRGEGSSRYPAAGTNGGGDGARGELTVRGGDARPVAAPAYGVRRFDAPMRIVMASPGGGGWGSPLRRDPARVLRDVRDELVSRTAAADVYGVILSRNGREVDVAATERRRRELAAALAD